MCIYVNTCEWRESSTGTATAGTTIITTTPTTVAAAISAITASTAAATSTADTARESALCQLFIPVVTIRVSGANVWCIEQYSRKFVFGISCERACPKRQPRCCWMIFNFIQFGGCCRSPFSLEAKPWSSACVLPGSDCGRWNRICLAWSYSCWI